MSSIAIKLLAKLILQIEKCSSVKPLASARSAELLVRVKVDVAVKFFTEVDLGPALKPHPLMLFVHEGARNVVLLRIVVDRWQVRLI